MVPGTHHRLTRQAIEKERNHMDEQKAFTDWVNEFGRAELARQLNVTWGAVYCWTTTDPRRRTRPRPEYANKIVELSKGKLTLADIYPKEAAHG